jgi:two-component system sensor histidine kinase DesK
MNVLRRALQPRGLLVAMHVPFVGFTAVQSVTGVGITLSGLRWSALPLVLSAAAIQVRHSLAAARGTRPRHWQWTLLLLLLITYVPAPLFALRWGTMHWFVVASLLMVLPPRLALPAVAIDTVGVAAWLNPPSTINPTLTVWAFTHDVIILLASGASLYGAARLVVYADELRATRAELAQLAIERERLRISRDLHDLLGHSLSAVALKGDLAHGLLERREVERAGAEIQSLVSVARAAFHDLRQIVHREPAVSLASELDRCTDILAAVGIETRIAMHAGDVPPKVDELFAWAVREGVTNIVRHSTATACSISIARRAGQLRLEIENDGAAAVSPAGSGLMGLVARAAALSGSARGQPAGGDHFILIVDVPEAAA